MQLYGRLQSANGSRIALGQTVNVMDGSTPVSKDAVAGVPLQATPASTTDEDEHRLSRGASLLIILAASAVGWAIIMTPLWLVL